MKGDIKALKTIKAHRCFFLNPNKALPQIKGLFTLANTNIAKQISLNWAQKPVNHMGKVSTSQGRSTLAHS